MKKVTVKQMLEELTEALVTQKEPKTYYWERENFNTGNLEMVEITEVDLLRDRQSVGCLKRQEKRLISFYH